jgi:hypothetical protein
VTTPAQPAAGGQKFVQPDSLSAGLVTQSSRVLWVHWHSGFRGTGLRVGDLIIAVNGSPQAHVGQLNEAQVWKDQGMTENAPVRLTVRRRAFPSGWQELELTGPLRPAITYVNDAGRHTIGPDGPDGLGNDGLGIAWSSWLEKWQRWAEAIMDDDWSRPPWATDPARAELEAQQPWLRLLAERYPGPFTDAITEDARTIGALLDGPVYQLTPDALSFRRLDEERAEAVATAGKAAREAFLAGLTADLIAEPPNPELLIAEPEKWAGKLIALPPIRPRDWLTEATHNWFAAQLGSTWCVVDTESDAAQRMQLATRRYTQRVTPNLAEDYAILGRIMPQARLVMAQGRAVVCLELEPVAATVGERMFVDLTTVRDGQSPFAGEDAARSSVPAPAADAPPEQVLSTFLAALKAADADRWLELFASWRVLEGAQPVFYPYRPPVAGAVWDVARRQILQEVCDARVVWRDDARVVVRGDEYPGLPRIEEAALEVDHIRAAGSEHRGFRARGLTRLWRLQRVDQGPWRIVTESGL